MYSPNERPLADVLSDVMRDLAPTPWTTSAVAAVATAPSFASLSVPYAAAARNLKQAKAAPIDVHVARLRELGAGALADHGIACMFRSLLLLTVCHELAEDARASLVDRVFRTGDNEERIALLCTLAYLPAPQTYAATAVEACRTNIRDVFVAIACDNDYPARWFDDTAFNQMVMKALFSNIELAHVRGLAARSNPELRRMARDYVAERRAAGRSVPLDIALAMGEGLQP
jgi:hypothetical protein